MVPWKYNSYFDNKHHLLGSLMCSLRKWNPPPVPQLQFFLHTTDKLLNLSQEVFWQRLHCFAILSKDDDLVKMTTWNNLRLRYFISCFTFCIFTQEIPVVVCVCVCTCVWICVHKCKPDPKSGVKSTAAIFFWEKRMHIHDRQKVLRAIGKNMCSLSINTVFYTLLHAYVHADLL